MQTAPPLRAQDLLAAAEACMQAADAADVQTERRAAFEIAQHQETIRLGLIRARHERLSQTPHVCQRLPLRIDGEDYGRVEARIPKEEFWHLVQQQNFGYEGFLDDGGLRDLLKTRPACRVQTISGRTTIGWRAPAAPPPRRVQFGRGTLNLAT